jgi:hypothetical protein
LWRLRVTGTLGKRVSRSSIVGGVISSLKRLWFTVSSLSSDHARIHRNWAQTSHRVSDTRFRMFSFVRILIYQYSSSGRKEIVSSFTQRSRGTPWHASDFLGVFTSFDLFLPQHSVSTCILQRVPSHSFFRCSLLVVVATTTIRCRCQWAMSSIRIKLFIPVTGKVIPLYTSGCLSQRLSHG